MKRVGFLLSRTRPIKRASEANAVCRERISFTGFFFFLTLALFLATVGTLPPTAVAADIHRCGLNELPEIDCIGYLCHRMARRDFSQQDDVSGFQF